MEKKHISELGKATQFSSTNQPDNPGRKKNKFKHLRDQYSLSAEDVSAIIEYQMSLSSDELQKLILDDNSKTVLEKAFAKAILEATKKGDLSQIEKLLDRKIGKVEQKVNSKIDSELNINIIMPKNDND